MEKLFGEILSMSVDSVWLIIAVIAVRAVLQKSPKYFRKILWALVGLRLVIPFSFESALSLIPHKVPQAADRAVGQVVAPTAPQGSTFADVIPALWVAVGVAFLIYGIISYIRLRLKIIDGVLVKDNIYQSDRIQSPFVCGFIKPKIYVPYGLDEATQDCVLKHEETHIKYADHIIKAIGFVVLCVHWFNPLVWVCFKLFTKDIELACDERVVKNYTLEKRKLYAEALLRCAVNEGRGIIHPLAFGEVSIKDRIKFVVSYKKSLKMVLVLFFIAVIVVAVCLGTVPKVSAKESAQNKIPVVEESTTEVYVEETTTEPVTEEVTEPTTEIAEYNAEYQETQPEFNLDDIDPEYREAFSIAQEEGIHVGEVMLRQSLEEQAEEYREMYNDLPTREQVTYPAVKEIPEVIELFPEPELPQTGFDVGSDKSNGVQRIPGLTAYSFP